MQKIFVTGYVGRDPEERITPTGKKLTTFPLGISVLKGGEKLTVWYKINCWDGVCGSILSHIKKGSCVTAVGDLNPPSTYQNKRGDIAVDLSVSCHSLSFAPTFTPKDKKTNADDDDLIGFGDS